MNWYLRAWKRFAVFNGRARRKEYWLFALFNILVLAVLAFIDAAVGLGGKSGGSPLAGLYLLAVFVPHLAVTVRRLHDTNRSGWWMLIGLVPFIGAIVLLVFLIQNSQPDENQYGQNPKAATA
jgi:uncharacterized membrane protein YhaH (DUF805 family)